LVRRYLPEALTQGCHLYWVGDINGRESACQTADLLIWDHDSGRNRSVPHKAIELPTVVIRRGIDPAPPPLTSIILEGTPSLDEITAAAEAYVPKSQ
jgi:hypothetical protein